MNDRELLFTEFFNKKLKERGFTLRQLSEASGISMKYLESFAHGRFENLPPTPYLRGYFLRLGEILNFDAAEWWDAVREDETVARAGKNDRLPRNRFSLRRKRSLAVGGFVLILIIGYFGFRASKILGEPKLTVTAPAEETSRVTEGHVLVSGQVKNADEVLINGEQAQIENDGFSKDVPLQPGMNSLEITAKKILGRETSVLRQVYYETSAIDLLRPETTSTTASSTGSSTEP